MSDIYYIKGDCGKSGVDAGFAQMISRIYGRSKKEFCQVRKDSLVLGIRGFAPWCEAFCDCEMAGIG